MTIRRHNWWGDRVIEQDRFDMKSIPECTALREVEENLTSALAFGSDVAWRRYDSFDVLHVFPPGLSA